jgi:hypothetical protein
MYRGKQIITIGEPDAKSGKAAVSEKSSESVEKTTSEKK